MQIRASALREVLGLLEPAVPRKTVLPILKCALVGNGKVFVTDSEVGVEVALPEAQERCCLPVKEVLQVLKGIPGNQPLTVTQSGQTLSLAFEGGRAALETHHPDDFPPVPEVSGIDLDLDERLISVLPEVLSYASREDTRPVLAGVTLNFGEELEVAAADGFRLAYVTVPITAPEEARRQVTIPPQAVKLLGKLWKKSPGDTPATGSNVADLAAPRKLKFTLGEDKARFRFGSVSLVAQLIPGTPPNFKKVIPQETLTEISFFAPDLLRAVKQLGSIDEKIRLAWEHERLTVSARKDDREGQTTIPLTTAGGTGRVVIGATYLQDYLKSKEDVTTMGISGDTAPVLFRSASPVTVLIMPMHVGE